MSYRIINEKDEKDRKLIESLIGELDQEFFPPLTVRYKNVSEFVDHYAHLGTDAIWLGVLERGKLIGAISASLGTTGEGGVAKKDAAYVSFIGVLKQFRGMNLAVLLSEKMENMLRKKGVRTIYVRTWSTGKAFGLYKKLGFEIEKIVQNERADGVHGVYFKKTL